MSIAAVIQMNSGIDVDANLHTAKKLIQQAAEQGAQLVVLPEMFCLMGADLPQKLAAAESFGSGKIQDAIAQTAQQNNIWIVAGTMPLLADDPNKVSASSLVFATDGQCVARYDKIHLFDVSLDSKESYRESDTTTAGNKIVVIDTPIGRLGLSVCYDIRFAEQYHELRQQGAEIIAVPAAFTVPTGQAHWQVLLRARAIENFCYVLGAAEYGLHSNDRSTYGHSTIIDPWGTVLKELTEAREGVLSTNIDLAFLKQARQKIPMQR